MKHKIVKRLLIVLAVLLVLGGITLTWMQVITGKKLTVTINTELKHVPEELQEILYYASFAPNSHNTQMWQVRLNNAEQKVSITLDKKRTLNVIDKENREAYLSIGAYLQNMRVAFKAYGYSTAYKIEENKQDPAVILFYQKAGAVQKHTLDTITKRHTDKSKFKKDPLKQETVTRILNKSKQLHYYSSDTESFQYLMEGTISAGEQQSKNQAARDELANWLRFSDKEAASKKDGLSAEQLGFIGIKKAFYYLLTNQKSAQGDTFAKQGNDTTKVQARHCAGFFVLTGNETKKDLIQAGMTLQDIWLQAVEDGVAIHPMSFMLEEEPYKSEIRDKLKLTSPVQMILRAGYVANYGENNKIRRNLADYIEVE